MPDTIHVYIGYDPRETVAYHVLAHSILSRASQPVAIHPLALTGLGSVFQRERNNLQSTDFAFTRFLTPYLAGYQGWAIFLDCDMLMLRDIAELYALRNGRFAVQAVKHDYRPSSHVKFLDQVQTAYEKKNWSSVMLLNCARCRALTPDYVNTASGLELHRFRWLESEKLIGGLPLAWNFLVGEYTPLPVPQLANLHFTIGGPYYPEYKQCDYAELWFAERDRMLAVAPGKHQAA